MLELIKVEKRYQSGKVLHDISMELPDYGMIGIMGPSGCGKSTLLHIIGGIDKDFSGDILFNGKSVKNNLHRYRNKNISFIFQSLYLVDIFKVLTNIKLPLFFYKHYIKDQQLDMQSFEHQKISDLSLGQRQKIAYLRSVLCKKKILLCDEPTASLDHQSADELMALLKKEALDHLVIIVSHNKDLIYQYCDEVYFMEDGQIMEHQLLSNRIYETIHYNKSKKISFSSIKLALLSLKAYKKRTYQLILGLFISLLCVFSSVTLSSSLEKQIYQYIYSLVPPSSLSFHSDFTIKEKDVINLSKHKEISRVQLFLDDYELLGIGFDNDHYEESKTLFIGDDSSPYENLLLEKGKYPVNTHDILLSLSTAKHLSEDLDVLIGKKIYAFYKVGLNIVSIEYNISGITNTTTMIDTLYQKPNAYIKLLQKQYNLNDLRASLGIIYIHQDYQRSVVKKDIEVKYQQYEFIETGLSTTNHVKDVMNKIKIVLYFFTFLSVLSSLFLIGEVMYLNVIEQSKNYAIMYCFGASILDLIKIVSVETLVILFLSFFTASILFYSLLTIGNDLLAQMLLSQSFKIALPFPYFVGILIVMTILIMSSQLFSIIHIYKMNIVDTLKK